MAAPVVVAVVHLLVRLEIPSRPSQIRAPRGGHLWLRPKGCAMDFLREPKKEALRQAA